MPPTSTKRTITSDLNSLNIEKNNDKCIVLILIKILLASIPNINHMTNDAF